MSRSSRCRHRLTGLRQILHAPSLYRPLSFLSLHISVSHLPSPSPLRSPVPVRYPMTRTKSVTLDISGLAAKHAFDFSLNMSIVHGFATFYVTYSTIR